MGDRFSQNAILVAGGTGGLGHAVSLAFLNEDATVIVTYRNQAEFEALAGAAGANGKRLEGHRVDITDEEAVQRLISTIVAGHARLDAVVNAVGGYGGGAKLWEQPPELLERMLALNLRSGYALSRAAIPAMVKQGRGSFVNVASKSGLDHPANDSAYAASKAAALAMMDSLAAELHGTGVRVNSLLPSIIDTEPNRRAMPKANFAKWPKPEEIARVVLFLCSEDAAVIHGASIPVYGAR